MSQLCAQRIELAFHPRDFRLPGPQRVAPDDIGFEGFDTPDLPIPKVLNPGSRQTQHRGCSRDPVSNLQAGGSPDCPVYQLAQIGEHSQGARRAQLSSLAETKSLPAEFRAPGERRPQPGGD